MQIISHRGYWLDIAEKNSETAFHRSFSLGFGTETDIRDLGGELMISHDPPLPGAFTLEHFLELHRSYAGQLPLALNIKADGLQERLKKTLERFAITDYFAFDMSIPDLLGYQRAGIPFFTRMSEYEPEPVLLEAAGGVWLDGFHGEWYGDGVLTDLLGNGKRVCLVSPELHGRSHLELWQRLAALDPARLSGLMLCTDLPEAARDHFTVTP